MSKRTDTQDALWVTLDEIQQLWNDGKLPEFRTHCQRFWRLLAGLSPQAHVAIIPHLRARVQAMPPNLIRALSQARHAHIIHEECAEDVRAPTASGESRPLTYLPFLGLDGYIVRGWSHILAGYPKSGKTELLTRLALAWPHERILYFTEEPKFVWEVRLAALPPGQLHHITLVYALAIPPNVLLDRIRLGDETTVILDTIRNLLTIRDESDNAEVARVLNPIIALCRHGGKTLLLAHHTRKGGGEHGEAITGGHAFLGVVDVALELTFMDSSGQDGRRRLRPRSRVISIPDLVYERTQDGSFRALGSPSALALAEVEQRLLHVLDDHWQTTSELLVGTGRPQARAQSGARCASLALCRWPSRARSRAGSARQDLSLPAEAPNLTFHPKGGR